MRVRVRVHVRANTHIYTHNYTLQCFVYLASFSGVSYSSIPEVKKKCDSPTNNQEGKSSDNQSAAPPRKMKMAVANIMGKISNDRAANPDLTKRLNDKFRLIKDPAQFHILERRVEILSAEKDMLTEYSQALDDENNSLKAMMVELTKQRCRNDLEHLRKKQIDLEKESLTMLPTNQMFRDNEKNEQISNRQKHLKPYENSNTSQQMDYQGQKHLKPYENSNTSQQMDYQGQKHLKPYENSNTSQQMDYHGNHKKRENDSDRYEKMNAAFQSKLKSIRSRQDSHFLQKIIPANVGNNQLNTSLTGERVRSQSPNGLGSNNISQEDVGPKLLTVPLAEWDKLKHQADLVLEENQILVDQKILYKKTIDDLTNEFQTKMKSHSEELLLLMQDKNTLEEGLLLANQDKHNLTETVDEMNKVYSLLEEKYAELLEEVEKKIDLTIHKEKLEKLNRTKSSEINMIANETNTLKSRMGAMSIEKDRLAVKLTDITAENSELHMRLKVTDNELRKSKQKLSQSVLKAEAACCQELVIRKTLSQVIKVAEKTVIDRNILADIVRQEKQKDNKLNTLNYVYQTNNIDQETCLFNLENVDYGSNISLDCDHNNYGDNNITGLDYGDKKIINYGDKNNIGLHYGDKNNIGLHCGDKKVFDRNKIQDLRAKLNYPNTDINKFREKHEMELNEMKDMVRLKQSYIEHIQKNVTT